MNVLSLFSGIGGLDLGLEWAGMRTVGQVEIDQACRQVLARHWPNVPRHDDVRTAVDWWGSEPRPHVHVIAGGFPCQPFSQTGSRRGADDERWGWPWFHGVVRALRPRAVVLENVPGLLTDRGGAFGLILADLAALGFDAEWSVLSACAMGAPHVRRRLFIVAHTDSVNGRQGLGERLAAAEDVQARDLRAGSWGDPHDGALAAARIPDRMADGLARRMVEAGGNAVVPAVAEQVGRIVLSRLGAEEKMT